MSFRQQRALSIMALFFLGLAGAASPQDRAGSVVETGGPGVVVEEVSTGSALEKAGLRPGDLLLTWERAPDPPANPEGDKGEIQTVFDWLWVQTEQAPRGTVRLHGERDGVATSFEIQKGPEWDAEMRPRMAADLLQMYTEGRRQVEAGDVEGGVALWNQLAQRAEPQAAPGLRSWVLLQAGEAWAKGGQGAKARSTLQAALAAAQDPQTRVAVGMALGESYRFANEMRRAEESFRAALEVGEAAWGESLQVARTTAKLGTILLLQNRLDEVEKLQTHALAIRQRWSPDSREVAESLISLSDLAWARGDTEESFDYDQRALAIFERWSPDSLAVAWTLTRLALDVEARGLYEQASADLLRALAIQEKKAPGSLDMSSILINLGGLARARGDSELAAEVLQRALEIRQRLAPESPGTAAILTNLGLIAEERGDLTAATKHFQRAMEIWGKAAPDGIRVAENLDLLGTIARLQGDLSRAWDHHRRALEIHERLDPGSLYTAYNLSHIGRVAEARGNFDLARDFQRRALAIFERLAPGTIEEAETLQQLGRLYRRMHRSTQAAQYLARAVDALESQVGKLGSSQDLQATFRASYAEIYHDAIELALERGHAAEAFHLMERSRARSFLTLLAERDLTFSGEIPDALERSRRDNAARYDQTLRKLAQWTPAAGEAAREALHHELSRLRRERDEVAAEIRKASPRLAELRQPQPLDLAAARKGPRSRYAGPLLQRRREADRPLRSDPRRRSPGEGPAGRREEVAPGYRSFFGEGQAAPGGRRIRQPRPGALPYPDRSGGRPGREEPAGADPSGRPSTPPAVWRAPP
ncbi:MAG: tetratricopeptide repeat protein [Thermoanaerobaculia bacterium]